MTKHNDSVSPPEAGAVTPDVRLRPLTTACAATGTCPTVYRTDRQTIVVQGSAVPGASAGITLPEGELLVEIPDDILLAAADRIRGEAA